MLFTFLIFARKCQKYAKICQKCQKFQKMSKNGHPICTTLFMRTRHVKDVILPQSLSLYMCGKKYDHNLEFQTSKQHRN